jgi:hypothetical protein
LRNSRVVTWLGAFAVYFAVLLARGWNGLDQIPSDPGYDYLWARVESGWQIFKILPFLHSDQPLIASITSSLPLEWHGLSTTLLTHLVWSICGVIVFTALRRLGQGATVSFIGGLLLVSTPWAAQSAVGNYGNVRWPILVATTVVICSQVARKQPRTVSLVVASIIASLSNPLHPFLLLLFAVGAATSAAKHRRSYLIAASTILIVVITNLLNADISGHSSKITSFWDGAGLFWVSGQVLPSIVALLGLGISIGSFRRWSAPRFFSVNLFVMVLLTAAASYRLGGIADRYYVTPAVLAAIGAMVLFTDLRAQSNGVRQTLSNLAAIALSLVLLVPTVRWFVVFPYLDSAPRWSTQVDTARQRCAAGEITEVEFITSSGDSQTDPIACDRL